MWLNAYAEYLLMGCGGLLWLHDNDFLHFQWFFHLVVWFVLHFFRRFRCVGVDIFVGGVV